VEGNYFVSFDQGLGAALAMPDQIELDATQYRCFHKNPSLKSPLALAAFGLGRHETRCFRGKGFELWILNSIPHTQAYQTFNKTR